MRLNHILLLTLSLVLYSACTIEPSEKVSSSQMGKQTYEDILVPKERTLLYSIIPNLTDNSITKSSNQELVSLESLIDRTKVKEEDFKSFHIVQIPFKDETNTSSVILSDSLKKDYNSDDITLIKKYLVLVKDNDTFEEKSMVTTFVPTARNIEEYGEDSFSYLDKSTFEGIVINSNLDGSFRSVYIYGEGHPILDSYFCKDGDNVDAKEKFYLSLVDKTVTKVGDIDGGTIKESVCVASKKDDRQEPEPPEPDREIDHPFHGGGGGGGSSSGKESGSNNDDSSSPSHGNDTIPELKDSITTPASITADRIIKDDVKTYIVNLYSMGPGDVLGGGEYPAKQRINCTALARPLAEFDRWTGDFSLYDKIVNIVLKKDIEATAYFWDILKDTTTRRPCYNSEKGMYNPLKKMSIASPGWSGLRGGTFGMVRCQNTKNHNGIDLYAEEGTEVYAMFDGVIGSPYVVTQPNLDENGNGEYPIDYHGDDNKAGNRIYIKSLFEGQNMRIGYCHLQAETPVAINPRTGKPFAPGDVVYAGELVAYTGRTGNAYNVDNKHLHLTYYKNWVLANPEEILNGKVDWNETMTKVLTEGLKGIKCDSERLILGLID